MSVESMDRSIVVRPLQAADRAAWAEQWQAYLAFYATELAPAQYHLTWQRLQDPAVPLWALGAFEGERMLGLVHYLYHPSAWTEGPYCYLQDLFVEPATRGQGVGRQLIETVLQVAREAGADRVYWLTQHDNHPARLLYDRMADLSGFIQYRKLLR